MRKRIAVILALTFVFVALSFAQAAQVEPSEKAAVSSASSVAGSLKYFAAALAVGIACIAGGIAVGQIGAAAMGAMAENPELSGKALPYAGLAEGICLWGFLVGLLILLR